MKTCEKCKAEFYKWDDTKVSDKYCVPCVVQVMIAAGLAEPKKPIDFVFQAD